MLSLYYGDWVFWEQYSPPASLGGQKVTFDGPGKLILINEGVTQIDFREDIYSAWKEWVKDPNRVNSAYELALSVIGGDPLPGNRSLGTTYFIENGWRIRTWEGNHELTVTGNFFTREGASAFVPTLKPWTITVNLNTSTLVETLSGSGVGSDVSEENIIRGVWEADEALSLLSEVSSMSSDIWNEIIDATKNETAKEKLRKIATKTQDIALG